MAGFLLIFALCVPPVPNGDVCELHRQEVSSLTRLVEHHGKTIQTVLSPCDGYGDPRYFLLTDNQRKERIPEFSDCLSEAEDGFLNAVVVEVPFPTTAAIRVDVIQDGWVFASVELTADGQKHHRGAEPSYGYSLELHRQTVDKTEGVGNALSRCGTVLIDETGDSDVIAAAVFTENGERIGEIQIRYLDEELEEDNEKQPGDTGTTLVPGP